MSGPRVLLLYHANPTTTAAYLEAALRQMARLTVAGEGQEVALPRNAKISLPDLLDRLGVDFDLVLEVEGENVETTGHTDVQIPCAWWAIDSHLHMSYDHHFFRARVFDHVFVAQKHHVARYRDWAWVSSSWLPLAADPAVFAPHEGPRVFDVGFVGNALPGLHEARRHLLSRLVACCERVLVARGAWREEVARELARCRLVFNRSLHEDVNMRVFEALACGRPLLTDRLDLKCGLEDLFTDGRHLILYDDATLEKTAERWLRDEADAEQIAVSGRKHVLKYHTYANRARSALRFLGLTIGAGS